MKLAPIADKVAEGMKGEHVDWDTVRDACDLTTNSDLPASVLDRLANMTMRRLEKYAFS